MTGDSRSNAPLTMPARSIRVAALLLALVTSAAGAQDSSAAPRRGWMVGGSLGIFGSGGQVASPELTTIGLHFTQVRPGAIGADISVGIIPRSLASGAFVAGTRVGLALPLALSSGVLLLPSVGLSLIGGVGAGGAGGTTGYNVGGAAVFGSGAMGVRTGVTWHRLDGSRSAFWLYEIGIARVPGRT